MIMDVEVSIVGYDRQTERLAVEHPVPPAAVPAAQAIANVPATDPDLIGAYPLDAEQARQIASSPTSPSSPTASTIAAGNPDLSSAHVPQELTV